MLLVRWFIIRGRAWASMHNLLMFCHGTQIMDNSRICHCLLFHGHGKQNFMQPFCLSRKLLRYNMLGLNFTTKSELNLWSCLWVSLCMALTWSKRNYCAWFNGTVCEQPALVYHSSQSCFHWLEFTEQEFVLACVQIWNLFAQFKFSVYGHTRTQTYIHTRQAMQSR